MTDQPEQTGQPERTPRTIRVQAPKVTKRPAPLSEVASDIIDELIGDISAEESTAQSVLSERQLEVLRFLTVREVVRELIDDPAFEGWTVKQVKGLAQRFAMTVYVQAARITPEGLK